MLKILADVAVLGVAVLHLYIVVLEMFLWEKPLGRRVFRTTAEFAAASKVLAANQGLYNGFLAAGLLWGLALGQAGDYIKVFFLSCIVVAGVFGAYTANKRILWVQGMPALIALILVLVS